MLSLEVVKNFLGIAPGNIEYDDFLLEDILLVTDSINSYCNRNLNFQSRSLQVYLKESQKNIVIADYPLKDVDSVTVDGVEQIYSFIFDGTVSAKTYFPCGALEIHYDAGFSEEDIPPVLKNVFIGIIKKRHSRRLDNLDVDDVGDVSSIAITGVMSVKYNNNSNDKDLFLEGYERILDRYKLIQV